MPKYVAFLRAINVGGHTVKMADLRRHFEAMAFAEVETFIASGNVIFSASATETRRLENQIESGLHAALGYTVATFLRTPVHLAAVARHRPFADEALRDGDHMLYVAFVAEPPGAAAQAKLHRLANEIDAFQVHGSEIYWLRRNPTIPSTFSGALLEKTLGQPATVRNITTVRRLAAKYGG
ncbi:MAG TPA: DUF1697 domain-containing protein [Caldilineaceae bacterium]|nr:DUF1697 domain-containing protein [Caldilineaceae bacterium]